MQEVPTVKTTTINPQEPEIETQKSQVMRKYNEKESQEQPDFDICFPQKSQIEIIT